MITLSFLLAVTAFSKTTGKMKLTNSMNGPNSCQWMTWWCHRDNRHQQMGRYIGADIGNSTNNILHDALKACPQIIM